METYAKFSKTFKQFKFGVNISLQPVKKINKSQQIPYGRTTFKKTRCRYLFCLTKFQMS